MKFVFTRAPLEEALLPQIAHALKTRIDSLSRLKYPGMWAVADKNAARDTPEKKASREKAAAIRYRLWGIVFLALGIFLVVPGLMKPGNLTLPLVVGTFAVILGIKRLFGKYVSSEEKMNRRYEASAKQLMRTLNGAQNTGSPTLTFDDEGMTLTSPGGKEETAPYTAFEYVIEEEDLILITFGTRVTVLRPTEIAEGDIDAFLPFLEGKATVLYLHPEEHPVPDTDEEEPE